MAELDRRSKPRSRSSTITGRRTGSSRSAGCCGSPRRPTTPAWPAELAESIIGLFKAEVIWRLGPWRSLEAVEFATLEWVDWFNNRRLLEPIGNIPPAEAEARYYAAQEGIALAA
jgi:putative transposase